MPLARFDNLDADQKARLLDAATAEFAAKGYEDASLNQILRAAAMSKGSLYYYFVDRDDLYATVARRIADRLTDASGIAEFAPARASEFWTALEAMVLRAVEAALRHPTEMQALRSFQRTLRRTRRPAFEPILEGMRQFSLSLVRRGQKLGCVRDDVPTAVLVELLESVDEVINRGFYALKQPARPIALQQQAALLVDTYRRILEPRPAPAATRDKARAEKGRRA